MSATVSKSSASVMRRPRMWACALMSSFVREADTSLSTTHDLGSGSISDGSSGAMRAKM